MIKEIIEKIKEYQEIYIFPHVKPDGDSLGSGFGLKYILKDLFPDKEIEMIGEHINDTSFMGEFKNINSLNDKNFLAISVDTANKSRIYDEFFLKANFSIRIDHHPYVNKFTDLEYIIENMPSTCSIITKMCADQNLQIPKKAAECLFYGTITDTNRFRYPGVTADVLRSGAYLIDRGIDIQKIYTKIYLKNASDLAIEKYVLNNYQTYNKIAYIVFTEKIINQLKVTREEVSEVVNKLENIKEYPIWFLVYQSAGKYRVRLRSRNITINDVASEYNGGGHFYAAGCTLNSLDLIPELLDKLDKKK